MKRCTPISIRPTSRAATVVSLGLLLPGLLLGGCATEQRSAGDRDCTAALVNGGWGNEPNAKSVRLPPAALGGSLALNQRLSVSAKGERYQADALLEVNPSKVSLAIVSMGQTAARMQWDGKQLTSWSAPSLPSFLTAERVLADMQLVFWPATAIRNALPLGWTLIEDPEVPRSPAGIEPEPVTGPHTRRLMLGSCMVAAVGYPRAGMAQLMNYRNAYQLDIESRPVAAPAPAAHPATRPAAQPGTRSGSPSASPPASLPASRAASQAVPRPASGSASRPVSRGKQ